MRCDISRGYTHAKLCISAAPYLYSSVVVQHHNRFLDVGTFQQPRPLNTKQQS